MKLLPVAAAVMAAALTLVSAARAAAPLPAPPASGPDTGGSAASTIFDAMLAIARAEADNASGAQNATASYNQAIGQFNAGQFPQARQSALNAIAQTAPAPLPAPSLYPLYIPQPAFNPMPLVVNADEADAENTVALARGTLLQCGSGAAPAAVQQQYATAVADLIAKNYLTARNESEILINTCAVAMQQLAQQAAARPQPSATPIPLSTYVPQPFATLIPDPALAQAPVVMPSTTPQPASHRFHFYGF